jgi:hypothetical protein
VEQPALFFNSFFLKVSVDLFSQNMYILINNPQGGSADISSFSGEKAWGQKETFEKYRQNQRQRFAPKAVTYKAVRSLSKEKEEILYYDCLTLQIS